MFHDSLGPRSCVKIQIVDVADFCSRIHLNGGQENAFTRLSISYVTFA